jgi:hypothetical protein
MTYPLALCCIECGRFSGGARLCDECRKDDDD